MAFSNQRVDPNVRDIQVCVKLSIGGETQQEFDVPHDVLESAARLVSALKNSGIIFSSSVLDVLSLFTERDSSKGSQFTSTTNSLFSIRDSYISNRSGKGSQYTSSSSSEYSMRDSTLFGFSEDLKNEDLQGTEVDSEKAEDREAKTQVVPSDDTPNTDTHTNETQSSVSMDNEAQTGDVVSEEQGVLRPCKSDEFSDQNQLKAKREWFRKQGPAPSIKIPITKANEAKATEALVKAVMRDDGKAAEEALHDGANLDGRTLLQKAAERGHLKVLKVLLDEGADVELEDAAGRKAIHVAAFYGQLKALSYLLKANAKVDSRTHPPTKTDSSGWTALHYAVYAGRLEVAQYLVSNMANVNAVSDSWRTPLDIASAKDNKVMKDYLKSVGGKKYKKLKKSP